MRSLGVTDPSTSPLRGFAQNDIQFMECGEKGRILRLAALAQDDRVNYEICKMAGRGSDASAACGRKSELSEWQRPRCPALPVADKAGHKRVQRSEFHERIANKKFWAPQTDARRKPALQGEAAAGHRNRIYLPKLSKMSGRETSLPDVKCGDYGSFACGSG